MGALRKPGTAVPHSRPKPHQRAEIGNRMNAIGIRMTAVQLGYLMRSPRRPSIRSLPGYLAKPS
jgi:hypothetical protein